MIHMSVKTVLVLSLVFASFAGSAQSRDSLIEQCYDLSEHVYSLASQQVKTQCGDKLIHAATHIERAGNFLTLNHDFSARQDLNEAVSDLQYAELSMCSQYLHIVHAKFRAHQLETTV